MVSHNSVRPYEAKKKKKDLEFNSDFGPDINDVWEAGRKHIQQQCQSGTPLLPCVPMKTSNKSPAVEWTHACTGLKLCPPFHTRSTEGTIGTLDTALNWSRLSTIHSNKRELCAGEVTWKRTDKTPFLWILPGRRHPCRALPWKVLLLGGKSVKLRGRVDFKSDKTTWFWF